jgi:hypothetical protein
MKTDQITPLMLLIATIISVNSFAQNNPYWMVGGNPGTGTDAVTSNSSVGPQGAFNLSLNTANTARLTIKGDGTNDGFVGIGTASPGYLLDVSGGDINLTDDANFYRIQGRQSLYFDAANNLMVG